MRGRLIGLAMVMVAVIGCSGSWSSPSPWLPPGPRASHPVYPIDAAPGKPLLTVEICGHWWACDDLPVLVVYGDGLVLRSWRAGSYPSRNPMLTTFSQTKLGADDLQRLIAAADDDGLLGPDAALGDMNVTDQDTRSFTLVVGDRTHVISVYGSVPVELAQRTDPVSRLYQFFDLVTAGLDKVVGHSLTWTPYMPAQVEVRFLAPFEREPRPAYATADPPWPLSTGPVDHRAPEEQPSYACMIIAGADVATFAEAVRGMGSDQVLEAPNGRWEVSAKPILPGQQGCVD